MGMSASLTLTELLKEALNHGANTFTIQTGLHPLVLSAKGVQTYDTQCTTYEDVDEFLRQLLSSREMREFRSQGELHFKSVFEKSVPLVGIAKLKKDVIKDEMLVELDVHVSLRRMSA
jgi:Tfp pilus assembly pilus retraction ATPase PilT